MVRLGLGFKFKCFAGFGSRTLTASVILACASGVVSPVLGSRKAHMLHAVACRVEDVELSDRVSQCPGAGSGRRALKSTSSHRAV